MAVNGNSRESNVNRLPTESGLEARKPTPAERRLAETRAALEAIIAPEDDGDTFPRSQTMRYLMGGKGKLAMLGAFTGLLLVKPRLAYGLMRFLPLGKLLPVARLLQSLR
jgi:hypothetical protein